MDFPALDAGCHELFSATQCSKISADGACRDVDGPERATLFNTPNAIAKFVGMAQRNLSARIAFRRCAQILVPLRYHNELASHSRPSILGFSLRNVNPIPIMCYFYRTAQSFVWIRGTLLRTQKVTTYSQPRCVAHIHILV
jgi:hypothetical protein